MQRDSISVSAGRSAGLARLTWNGVLAGLRALARGASRAAPRAGPAVVRPRLAVLLLNGTAYRSQMIAEGQRGRLLALGKVGIELHLAAQ